MCVCVCVCVCERQRERETLSCNLLAVFLDIKNNNKKYHLVQNPPEMQRQSLTSQSPLNNDTEKGAELKTCVTHFDWSASQSVKARQ